MRKVGRPAIRRLARRPWGLIYLLGSVLFLGGVLLLRKDISFLAGLFSQTGSGNPRMAERVNQLPLVLMLTGIELLVLGYSGRRLQIPLRSGSAGDRGVWYSKQNIMRGLTGLYALIAALTLNLCVVTVAGHLGSSLDEAEKIKTDFGEANGLVEAVRQLTPNDASILIQTQQPLKYLLNYELYPRHFYFHPSPSLNAAEIPSNWMNDHHIGWTLYIADDEPLRFALSRRKDME
jgi:hypothetical protein